MEKENAITLTLTKENIKDIFAQIPDKELSEYISAEKVSMAFPDYDLLEEMSEGNIRTYAVEYGLVDWDDLEIDSYSQHEVNELLDCVPSTKIIEYAKEYGLDEEMVPDEPGPNGALGSMKFMVEKFNKCTVFNKEDLKREVLDFIDAYWYKN